MRQSWADLQAEEQAEELKANAMQVDLDDDNDPDMDYALLNYGSKMELICNSKPQKGRGLTLGLQLQKKYHGSTHGFKKKYYRITKRPRDTPRPSITEEMSRVDPWLLKKPFYAGSKVVKNMSMQFKTKKRPRVNPRPSITKEMPWVKKVGVGWNRFFHPSQRGILHPWTVPQLSPPLVVPGLP